MKPFVHVSAAWWLQVLVAVSPGPTRGAHVQAGDDAGTGSLQLAGSVTEVHQVVVTLQRERESVRHGDEKARLMRSFEKTGSWTASHPRHRLLDALYGFLKYRERQEAELARLRSLYKNVSKAQRALLEHHLSYSSKFDAVEQKLASNQVLCDAIVHSALEFYGLGMEEVRKHVRDVEAAGQQADRISVSQALKHIVRDWTLEGQHERNATFSCLLGTLTRLFPDRSIAEPVRVLLPGAGLGRLGHDLHRLGGYQVTVNEWSMYMNVVYRFLEEHSRRHGEAFHPFVDGWSHHATDRDMHRELAFPDVDIDPQSVLMVEGDFTTAFRHQQGHYDIVVTYFFIDTARNLLGYFDTIKKVLKEGGYWINLGPLLYGTSPFVQLSLQDIVKVTEAMGFQYVDTGEECGRQTFVDSTVRGMEAVYGFDKEALTKNSYNAQFWVARRR